VIFQQFFITPNRPVKKTSFTPDYTVSFQADILFEIFALKTTHSDFFAECEKDLQKVFQQILSSA
jgi:hypothetical protein